MTEPRTSPHHVAVLGLGRMGRAIAIRLADQGHTVTGWSRAPRELPGITRTATPAAAVEGAAVVVLALFDGQACRDVVDQLGDPLGDQLGDQLPATVVNTSTVGPEEAAELEEKVAARGVRYLHAPIMGSIPAVSSGSATLLVGGEPDEATTRVLTAIGSVVPCGDTATAAAAKLLANSVLARSLLAVRSTCALGADLGLDPALTLDVLERTALGGLTKAKRSRIETGDFGEAEFTVAALAKDVALLAQEAPVAADLSNAVEEVRRSTASDADVAALCLPAPPPLPHNLEVAPAVSAPPEVLEPLLEYVAGHATGDPAHHRRAFLPTAHVEGVRDGRFSSWTLDDYCALFTGAPAADEDDRRRRIDHVAVHGTVATATLTLWHGADTFTDVFLLVRAEDGWRIANKTYDRG